MAKRGTQKRRTAARKARQQIAYRRFLQTGNPIIPRLKGVPFYWLSQRLKQFIVESFSGPNEQRRAFRFGSHSYFNVWKA
jgi:hypothetical protein